MGRFLKAQPFGQRQQRLPRHRERRFTVGKRHAHAGCDTLKLRFRRAIARRPDHQRRLKLSEQLQIGLGAQPDVDDGIRQRRIINPQAVVRHIRHRVRHHAKRDQLFDGQPFERHDTFEIHRCRTGFRHVPHQRRESHRRHQTPTAERG